MSMQRLQQIKVNGFGGSVIVEIFIEGAEDPVTLTLDRIVAWQLGQQLSIAANAHDALDELLAQPPPQQP